MSDQSGRDLTLTVDSIDDATNSLDAVEALLDRNVSPSQVEIALDLSDDEAERIESFSQALSTDITHSGSVSNGVTATPVDNDKSGSNKGSMAPPEHDKPDAGEVQPSPVTFDPPDRGTIQYAALALLCYETEAEGDSWLTSNELAEPDYCPYTSSQISSALSLLWRKRGCVSRRGLEKDLAVEYRPITSAREHAVDNGPFPWPEDGGDPPDTPEGVPFYVPE